MRRKKPLVEQIIDNIEGLDDKVGINSLIPITRPRICAISNDATDCCCTSRGSTQEAFVSRRSLSWARTGLQSATLMPSGGESLPREWPIHGGAVIVWIGNVVAVVARLRTVFCCVGLRAKS